MKPMAFANLEELKIGHEVVIPVFGPTGTRAKIIYSLADRQASQLDQTG